MILSGDIQSGERLHQVDLAKRLGISRIPLREAFRQLEAEGLVQLRSNKGAIAARMTADQILEYQEMRARLEGWLLQLAIPVITEADLEAAREVLEQMRSCADEDWEALNRRFHAILYEPANRPTIMETVASISVKTYRPLREVFHKARDRERSIREHGEILELVAAGNTAGAVGRLESHIMLNIQGLVDRLRAIEARQK